MLKNVIRISLALIIALMLLLSLSGTALATTYYPPNVSMQLTQLAAYKNCLALGDQGYLINFNIGYTSNQTPSIPIDYTFIFRLSESGVFKSTTTAYGYYLNGYGSNNVSQSGIAWIYFTPSTIPTWSGNITITYEGNPTLSWYGGTPPSTSSSSFSLWYDGGTIANTSSQLTARLTYIAHQLETEWGVALLLSTPTGDVLTTAGEDYFTNTIPNLRTICPNLFSQTMYAPSFPENTLVLDYFVGSSSGNTSGTANVTITTQYAQTFTATGEYVMTGVQVPVYRVDTPGTLTVSLRDTTGLPPVAVPNAVLASGTYGADTLTTDTGGQWIDVAFTADYTLTTGTTYAIVLVAAVAGAGESVNWLHDISNRYTAGHECSDIPPAAWVVIGTSDCMFELLVRGGAGISFGHRYEMRLLGTIFDVTQIATNWGMTNMMVSTLVWLAVIITLIVALAFATKSMDTWWILFCFMAAYGWRAGFADTYLLVGVILASSLVIMYGFWYKRTY